MIAEYLDYAAIQLDLVQSQSSLTVHFDGDDPCLSGIDDALARMNPKGREKFLQLLLRLSPEASDQQLLRLLICYAPQFHDLSLPINREERASRDAFEPLKPAIDAAYDRGDMAEYDRLLSEWIARTK